MRVVSVGDLVTDFYYNNSKNIGVDGGKSCHNIVINLNKLGQDTAAIGICGNDILGEVSIKSLNDLGVDTSLIEMRDNIKTRSFHINFIDGDFTSKKRCPICSEKEWYDDGEITFNFVRERLNKDDHIVIDNLCLLNREIISKCKNKLYFDIGYEAELENMTDKEIKDIFTRSFEIINMNQRVEKYLIKRFNNMDFINCKLFIITRGKDGADFIYNGKTYNMKVKSVKEVDSNGAGDAFFASIINDYINNSFDPGKSFERATNLTKEVVSHIGARGHLHNIYKIKKYGKNCLCKKFEYKKATSRCSLNVQHLESRLLKTIDKNIGIKLSKIRFDKMNNAIFTGTGGSYGAAVYASKVINTKYGVFTKAMYPRDVLYQNNEKVDGIFLFSYSGTTDDIIRGSSNIDNKKKYIITKGKKDKVSTKTGINNKNIFSYYGSNNTGKDRGFLSFEGTLAPASIFLSLVDEDPKNTIVESFKYWKNYFDEYFKNNKKLLKEFFKKGRTINIYYGDYTVSAAMDLESKFTESGYCNILLHEKKNFSHGRFINYENLNNNYSIYLKTNEITKYEDKLINYLDKDKTIILESKKSGLIAEYDLLLMVQYFIYYVSKLLEVDLSKPNYSDASMDIYFYKGEL